MINNVGLNSILAPCRNRRFGSFYAIVLLLISIASGLIWLLCKAGCYIFRGLKHLYKQRQLSKCVQSRKISTMNYVHSQLSLFGKLEYCLMRNNNVLYYTIKSYSNRNGILKFIVDFNIPADKDLWNVNQVLSSYLIDVGYMLRIETCKKYKGYAILTDMEQSKLEYYLSQRYGTRVTLMELADDPLMSQQNIYKIAS